jgi:hypothetical protein
VTRREEHRRVPVALAGPGRYAAGSTTVLPFEIPVPPLGPATFEGTVSRMTWAVEVKLDVPGFDPSLEVVVRVLQPTALLRAGVVDVGQFALFESVRVEGDGAAASIALDPVPMCVAAPFSGTVAITTDRPIRLQEIRLELRVRARSTVSSGKNEEIALWAGRVVADGDFAGSSQPIAFSGALPPSYLPTVRLPHGAADAELHVILARPMAFDIHLVRDVGICSTTEI